MQKKLNGIRPYIVTPIIVLVLIITIYFIKGVYPFGNGTVVWGDLYQQMTLYHYKFYDIFLGNSSIFYDFQSAMGMNFFGVVTYYLISPFSFLTLLFPRENIYQLINIILILKIMCISLASVVCIKYIFKNIKDKWVILLSVAYAFSGYTFIMYQIIEWLDFVILFPILVMALIRLFNLNKSIMYASVLTIALIFNFYISFMLILFIFLCSWIYIKIYIDLDKRKDAVLNLGIGTVLPILFTAPLTIPTAIQILNSNRMPNSIIEILNSSYAYVLDKISFFFLTAIVIPFVILLIFKIRENRKFVILTLAMLFLTLIPVVVNQVNILWHMGSYSGFPLRFGFIPIYILILMAAYYIDKYGKDSKTNLGIGKMLISIISIGLVLVTSIYILRKYYNVIQDTILTFSLHTNKFVFLLLFILFIITLVCYIIIIFFSKNNLNSNILYASISLIMVVQIVFNGIIYLGIDKLEESINNEYDVMNEFSKYDFNYDGYYRIKDKDKIFTSNMSWIVQENSLSHFTSLTSKNHMDTMKKLGYSSTWMRVSGVGGTIFTDSLFNIRYVLSDKILSDEYYNYITTVDSVNIYENKGFIPNGLILEKNKLLYSNNVIETKNIFVAQNNIYNILSNSSDKLFTEYDDFILNNLQFEEMDGYKKFTIKDKNKKAYIDININLKEKSNLYLDLLLSIDNSKNADVFNSLVVYVNDKLISAELTNKLHKAGEAYPNLYNNGLLDLGVFESGTVNIRLEVTKDFKSSEFLVGAMNIDKYKNLTLMYNHIDNKIVTRKNKIISTVKGSEGQELFLTIPYDNGWICKVNNKRVQINKSFDNFISIPLENGINEIEMTFIPQGFKVGIMVNIITIIMLFHFMRFYKIKRKFMKKCSEIMYHIYGVLWYITICIVYLIPIVVFSYKLIR